LRRSRPPSRAAHYPAQDNSNAQHLARVVSVGSGREGEGGMVTPNAGLQEGDLVYCKVRTSDWF
jgi:hypothetical protein